MKLPATYLRRNDSTAVIPNLFRDLIVIAALILLFCSCSTERIIFRSVTVAPPILNVELPSTIHYPFADTIPLVVARIDTIKAQVINGELHYPEYIGVLTDLRGDTTVIAKFRTEDYTFSIWHRPDTVEVPVIDTIRLPGNYFELKGDDWTERIIWLAVSAIGIISVALYRRKKTTNNQQSIDN